MTSHKNPDIEFWDDGTGCCFPGRCCMPGEHLRSECHTAEMMEEYLAEQGEDQRSSLVPRGRKP